MAIESCRSRKGQSPHPSPAFTPRSALRTHRADREAGAVVAALRTRVRVSQSPSSSIPTPSDHGECQCDPEEWPKWRRNEWDRTRAGHRPTEPHLHSLVFSRWRKTEAGIVSRRTPEVSDGQSAAANVYTPVIEDARTKPKAVAPHAPDPHHHQHHRGHRAAPLHRLADSRVRLHLSILLNQFHRLSPCSLRGHRVLRVSHSGFFNTEHTGHTEMARRGSGSGWSRGRPALRTRRASR